MRVRKLLSDNCAECPGNCRECEQCSDAEDMVVVVRAVQCTWFDRRTTLLNSSSFMLISIGRQMPASTYMQGTVTSNIRKLSAWAWLDFQVWGIFFLGGGQVSSGIRIFLLYWRESCKYPTLVNVAVCFFQNVSMRTDDTNESIRFANRTAL